MAEHAGEGKYRTVSDVGQGEGGGRNGSGVCYMLYGGP